MNTAEIPKQDAERFIIAETDEGFRVISPLQPAKQYIVSGTPEEPTCTCAEFHDRADPDWKCSHILAVLQSRTNGTPGNGATEPTRRNGDADGKKASPKAAGKAEMLIKRSVSPDGRIDSLSVEFSTSVEKKSAEEIRVQAEGTIRLQSQIIEGFLKSVPRSNGQPAGLRQSFPGHGAVPAQLLRIEGMAGRWGKRQLFITVSAANRTIKLFGNAKQLAEAITSAGYDCRERDIQEGATLNLACRVITRPSEDGRYVNVERLLPPETSSRFAGGRS